MSSYHFRQMSCLFHWSRQHLVAKGIKRRRGKKLSDIFRIIFVTSNISNTCCIISCSMLLSSGGKNMGHMRPRKGQAQKGSIGVTQTAPLAHIQGTPDGKLLLMEENLIQKMRKIAKCEKMRTVTFVSDRPYTVMLSFQSQCPGQKNINQLKKYWVCSLSFSYC